MVISKIIQRHFTQGGKRVAAQLELHNIAPDFDVEAYVRSLEPADEILVFDAQGRLEKVYKFDVQADLCNVELVTEVKEESIHTVAQPETTDISANEDSVRGGGVDVIAHKPSIAVQEERLTPARTIKKKK